jgi:hypothetical protein
MAKVAERLAKLAERLPKAHARRLEASELAAEQKVPSHTSVSDLYCEEKKRA